jgi:uncharacterized sulfatase
MSNGNQPNILVFFTDQQRWDTVGAYGQPLDVTPNLDRMAREGVRFDRAFTCQPVCGPARACLQTGKYATETGCVRNHIALPTDETTLAHLLGGQGYQAGYIGKWHLASGPGDDPDYRTTPVPPERRGGYDDYWLASDVLEFTSHGYDGHMFDGQGNRVEFPEGRYRADAMTDFAIDFLREKRDPNRPFFLFLSYIEPHHQNDNDRYEGPHGSKEMFADFVPPADLAAMGEQGDWRESYPDYLGCIHSLDANLGRLRDELESLGLADDTLVVFTSDHGNHFRTRNREYKRSCHEASIRIPLVIHGPGFEGGIVRDELVSLIDLPPTIASAGGTTVPSDMKGRRLQDLAAGRATDWPEEVFLQISEDHVGRAIRTDRWKYEVWVPSGEHWSDRDSSTSEVYHEKHLFDLHADPNELHDLVNEPDLHQVRSQLAETLKRRMVQAGEQEPQILPAR